MAYWTELSNPLSSGASLQIRPDWYIRVIDSKKIVKNLLGGVLLKMNHPKFCCTFLSNTIDLKQHTTFCQPNSHLVLASPWTLSFFLIISNFCEHLNDRPFHQVHRDMGMPSVLQLIGIVWTWNKLKQNRMEHMIIRVNIWLYEGTLMMLKVPAILFTPLNTGHLNGKKLESKSFFGGLYF